MHRQTLTFLLLLGVTLAGCSSEPSNPEPTTPTTNPTTDPTNNPATPTTPTTDPAPTTNPIPTNQTQPGTLQTQNPSKPWNLQPHHWTTNTTHNFNDWITVPIQATPEGTNTAFKLPNFDEELAASWIPVVNQVNLENIQHVGMWLFNLDGEADLIGASILENYTVRDSFDNSGPGVDERADPREAVAITRRREVPFQDVGFVVTARATEPTTIYVALRASEHLSNIITFQEARDNNTLRMIQPTGTSEGFEHENAYVRRTSDPCIQDSGYSESVGNAVVRETPVEGSCLIDGSLRMTQEALGWQYIRSNILYDNGNVSFRYENADKIFEKTSVVAFVVDANYSEPGLGLATALTIVGPTTGEASMVVQQRGQSYKRPYSNSWEHVMFSANFEFVEWFGVHARECIIVGEGDMDQTNRVAACDGAPPPPDEFVIRA